MITLCIGQTEIRAMHGAGAALPVLCLLALEGYGLDMGYLETGTGYKRTAIIQACRLLNHMHLVDYDEPRPNTLRNIRLTAAVQLPLPGTHTHTIPAGPVSHPTGDDGQDGAPARGPKLIGDVIQNLAVAKFSASNSAHGVGGGGFNQSISLEEHHQQTPPPNFDELARVRGLLRVLGVWPNVLAELEGADLADVLGWIAYAADPANGVTRRAALIAANLKAGRESAAPYRPFRICRTCQRIETVCECETPALHVPQIYDALASASPAASWGETAAEWLAKRWYCPICFGHPCQCQEAE